MADDYRAALLTLLESVANEAFTAGEVFESEGGPDFEPWWNEYKRTYAPLVIEAYEQVSSQELVRMKSALMALINARTIIPEDSPAREARDGD